MNPQLGPQDLAQLRARGIDEHEAVEQLRRLREGFAALDVLRPATVDDGIARLGPRELSDPCQEITSARARGRVQRFVPASGAASRMFQSLLSVRHRDAAQTLESLRAEGGEGGEAARFCDELARFAFADLLGKDPRSLDADVRQRLAALLDQDGLDYARSPKGLIAFHRVDGRARTGFEEQLQESLGYADQIHFTVSPEHRGAVEEHVARGLADPSQRVSYSEQSPATDTLAGDGEGVPIRDESGALVLRPGGHGSLLHNLHQLGGDLVYLKNIDNVAPSPKQALSIRWKLLLGERLLALQTRIFAALERWDAARPDASELRELEEFCALSLGLRLRTEGLDDGARRERVHRALERPLRVCGMVRNQGEPGGGPYWVRGEDGDESLQIVEASQLDRADPTHAAALAAATHFNPVDLVCALRDRRGESFELARFVDPQTGFLSEKSKDGVTLRALERPGLWNGSMARWNTQFVEVPVATFTPVKTVFDLLRPEHQVD